MYLLIDGQRDVEERAIKSALRPDTPIIIVTLAPPPKEKEKSARDVAAIRISNINARNFVSGDL